MKALRTSIVRLLSSFHGRGSRDREIAEELESHLQLHIADNIRAGMNPEDARRNALLKLGGLESAKEQYRDQARASWLEALWRDLRFAARLLWKSPGFTAVVAGSLAFGIAINTLLFTVVNGLFLRPLPYREPDRLMSINQPRRTFPLEELRQAQSFDGVTAFIARNFPVTSDGSTRLLYGCRASANLFSVLGVQPELGRTFAPDEDGKPVVVLGYEYWRKLSGDPKIIGQSLVIGEVSYTVIGVLPADFTLWFRDANLWIPYRMTEGRAFARLRPGVSLAQAQTEASAIVSALPAEPGADPRASSTRLIPLATDLLPGDNSTIWLLQAAVALVLLIVCANIGNLMLVRANARHREFAIRAAIGAGRAQVLRQLATEGAILGALGGVGGLLLAKASMQLVRTTLPAGIARVLRGADGLAMDYRVLAFAAGISIAAVLLFGVAPAIGSLRIDVLTCLKGGTRGPTREHRRFGSLLVSAEVGLALMLLIAAGLTLKSLAGLNRQYLGFSADHVLRVAVDLQPSRYPHPEQFEAFFSNLVERLEALPGVESASAYGPQFFPFGGPRVRGSLFEIQGQPGAEARAEVYTAGPKYFRTVRIPLLRGRVFTDADKASAAPVAVISATVANRYWGGRDPVGHLIRVDLNRADSPWVTVVGVVGDVRNPIGLDVQPTVYRPFAQAPRNGGLLMVRTASDPLALAPEIRELIHTADATVPDPRIASLETGVADYISPQRFTTSIFGGFAAAGLLLAAMGIFGVTRYWVGVRIPEIGVRLALGATKSDVVRLVAGAAAKLVVMGVLGGLAGAVAVERWMASQLYGVTATDPAVLGIAALTMGLVAMAAAFFPARSAGRIDPLTALRQE